MFGGIYFITPFLAPLGGVQLWASRILLGIPTIALVLLVMRQTGLFTEILHRVKQKPTLILGLTASGALISVQLWLFAWAPLNGRGLQVALGYFLLPLVLVIVGRFLYQDNLKWWHWLAAGIAAVGVTVELFNVGGISWETLLVAFGYPLYFILRRAMGTASTGGMLWEFICVLPVAVVVMVWELTRGTSFTENPALWWLLPLFAFVASIAIWMYVLASKLLPISIFGLLSYVEPALLVVAALLIGERISENEVFTYVAIWAAVLVLLAGGIWEHLRGRRRR